MPTVNMPKLSDTMTEGTIVRWIKKKGDTVTMGDILAEVETDKATMEMEAFDEGVLQEIYVPDGGKTAVGAKVALILAEGEKADAAPKAEKSDKSDLTTKAAKPEAGEAKKEGAKPAAEAPKEQAKPAESDARIKASP